MREVLVRALGPNRRNAGAVAAVAGLLVIGHLLVPDRRVRYGAYLLAFSVWMAWFVATTVEVLAERGE